MPSDQTEIYDDTVLFHMRVVFYTDDRRAFDVLYAVHGMAIVMCRVDLLRFTLFASHMG